MFRILIKLYFVSYLSCCIVFLFFVFFHGYFILFGPKAQTQIQVGSKSEPNSGPIKAQI